MYTYTIDEENNYIILDPEETPIVIVSSYQDAEILISHLNRNLT